MAKMTNVYVRIICDSFSRIYDMGDSGLDYMDRHVALTSDNMQKLMSHVYNDTLYSLTAVELSALASALQTVVADAEFDLETF